MSFFDSRKKIGEGWQITCEEAAQILESIDPATQDDGEIVRLAAARIHLVTCGQCTEEEGEGKHAFGKKTARTPQQALENAPRLKEIWHKIRGDEQESG